MKKIISVFQRNDADRLIRDEVVPGAEWVLAGEGVATRKYDGTCTMLRNGNFYKRYELKKGREAPVSFESAQGPDPVTGDQPGWVPVGEGPEDKWHRVALENTIAVVGGFPPNGSYEAIGPHFQSNPEEIDKDILIKHGEALLSDFPRDFQGMRDYLKDAPIEGVVFHHPDGRMAKVKTRDFGLKRPNRA